MRTSRKTPAKAPNYKSKWEANVAKQIESLGFPVKYEQTKIDYEIPASLHKYTPDFEVNGWYIEAKGKFDRADRKKHLLLQEQYPKLKIILLFQNANQRLSKQSKTTYAMWCEKNGIRYFHQVLKAEAIK